MEHLEAGHSPHADNNLSARWVTVIDKMFIALASIIMDHLMMEPTPENRWRDSLIGRAFNISRIY